MGPVQIHTTVSATSKKMTVPRGTFATIGTVFIVQQANEVGGPITIRSRCQ